MAIALCRLMVYVKDSAAWCYAKSVLCVDVCVRRIFLDELAAWPDVLAHEHGEDGVGLDSVVNGDLLEGTVFGVHRRVPKLVVVHLTETFVALRMDLVLVAAAVGVDELLALLFGPAILLHLALLAEVKRRGGEVDVSFFDQSTHATEEEGEDQGGNVATVHVGIGHDDHLVVTELR